MCLLYLTVDMWHIGVLVCANGAAFGYAITTWAICTLSVFGPARFGRVHGAALMAGALASIVMPMAAGLPVDSALTRSRLHLRRAQRGRRHGHERLVDCGVRRVRHGHEIHSSMSHVAQGTLVDHNKHKLTAVNCIQIQICFLPTVCCSSMCSSSSCERLDAATDMRCTWL